MDLWEHTPARNTASGKFSLSLLNSNFLEVDKAWLVHIKHETWPIAADWISTDCWLEAEKDLIKLNFNNISLFNT